MVIGEALKGQKRDKAFISLKFGALVAHDGSMYGLDVRPLTIKNYIIFSHLELVEALREIVNEKRATVPQLAIAWLLSKDDDIITLVGSSRRATLKDSLKAIDVNLSVDDIQRIENAIPADKMLVVVLLIGNLKME